MKHLWLVLFVTVVLGCQEPVPGSCYRNPAGGTGDTDPMPIGAGVGVSAAGDYATDPPKGPLDVGDGVGGGWSAPPRQPLDAPPPGCLSVPGSPCEEKCIDDCKTAAGTCAGIDNQAQRSACQDGAYTRYKGCRNNCLQINDCLEDCKNQCDEENRKCIARCPKGDKNCMNECNQTTGRCYKECEKRCK